VCRGVLGILSIVATGLLGGCGAPLADLKPVRLTELGQLKTVQLPLLIDVAKGDRVPVTVTLNSNLFASQPDSPTITVEAKQSFLVLVPTDGPPRFCLRTPELDCSPPRHGTFQVGIGAAPGKPAIVSIAVTQQVGTDAPAP